MKYGMGVTHHLGRGLGADYGAAGVGTQGGDGDGEEGSHFGWGFELMMGVIRISDKTMKQHPRQAATVVDIRCCLVWMRRRRGRDMDCRSCLGSAERWVETASVGRLFP